MLLRTPTRKVALDVHMWDAEKHEWDTSFYIPEEDVNLLAKEVEEGRGLWTTWWWECTDESLDIIIESWREECKTANAGEDGEYLRGTDMEAGDYWELDVTPVDEDGDYID